MWTMLTVGSCDPATRVLKQIKDLMGVNIMEHLIGWLPTFEPKLHGSNLDPNIIHSALDLEAGLNELQKALKSARTATEKLFIVNKVEQFLHTHMHPAELYTHIEPS